MKKIIFLVSGNGGTLKFLYHAINQLNLELEITGVIADRNCQALNFAEKHNLFYKKIRYNKDHSSELQVALAGLEPDLIITNVHKIIDVDTINRYPGKFINLHYSLLPGFSGLIGMETVNRAKEQNVGFVGGTCHFVDEHVDAGKIIQQGCFAVDWENDEKVVDTLYKTSCICLLNSVCKIFQFSESLQKRVSINKYDVHFSLDLQFEYSFSESFWDIINSDS